VVVNAEAALVGVAESLQTPAALQRARRYGTNASVLVSVSPALFFRRGPVPHQLKADVRICIACHGEQGVSVSPEYPNLAGQSGAAIYKQLSDYRTGSRTNQLMTDIAKALDEATLADVAAYYAAQPTRNPDPAS
jgi:cytochrome c553